MPEPTITVTLRRGLAEEVAKRHRFASNCDGALVVQIRDALDSPQPERYTREEVVDALREADAEHRREPLTDVIASVWDRLFPGEEMRLAAALPADEPSFCCSGVEARYIREESKRLGIECDRPPPGWSCSRPEGHDGPCAAFPDQQPVEATEQLGDGWRRSVAVAFCELPVDSQQAVLADLDCGSLVEVRERDLVSALAAKLEVPDQQPEQEGEAGELRCGECGKRPHSTLTDQCPHCGAKNYGQPEQVQHPPALSDDDRERLLTIADRITGGDPEEIDAAFLRKLAGWTLRVLAGLRDYAAKYRRKEQEVRDAEKADRDSGKLAAGSSYEATWNYYQGLWKAYEHAADQLRRALPQQQHSTEVGGAGKLIAEFTSRAAEANLTGAQKAVWAHAARRLEEVVGSTEEGRV